MSVPAPLATAVVQSAEIAGQATTRTISGLASQILEATRNVRVNGQVAAALYERTQEMVDAIDSMLDSQTINLDTNFFEALKSFERTLADIQDALRAQGQRSYLSQLLYRERDRDNLVALSERLSTVFNVVMVYLRLQTSAMAQEFSTEIDEMAARHQLQLELLPDVAVDPVARIPPRPNLHFGRTAETQAVVDAVIAQSAGRVAILGGPGMGKTTLAAAVLHHPSVIERFGARRFFVRCDAIDEQSSCLVVIAAAFGVSGMHAKATERRLLDCMTGAPALLVLDNFESAWEAHDQRQHAEHLLQLFATVETLSFIVTLRGTERPNGVQWTRPFLPPLTVLSAPAAKHIFLAIADVSDAGGSLDRLLAHMDNLPLAIVLTANLAQSESIDTLLSRWNEVATAMLVRGGRHDRTTSLEVSIELSLRSARMLAVPTAQRLLSLLALLPNGVADTDIRIWGVENAAQSLSAVLRVSLAQRSADGRVYVLAPIRSFMLAHHAPSDDECAPIYEHYFGLAELVRPARRNVLDAAVFLAVAMELGNIESVVRFALRNSGLERGLRGAIKAVVCLGMLYVSAGIGSAPELLPIASATALGAGLHELRADLLLCWARVCAFGAVPGDQDILAREALEIYERIGNTEGATSCRIFLIASLPHDDAVAEARRLFADAEARDDRWTMAHASQELGVLLSDKGNALEAIASHELAIKLALQATGGESEHVRLIGNGRFLIAGCLASLGKMDDAIRMYQEALRTYELGQFPNGVVRAHQQLAETLRAQGALTRAIEHAGQALAVKGTEGLRHYAENYMILAEARALAGNMDAARSAVEAVLQLEPADGLSPASQCRHLYVQARIAHLCGDQAEARALLTAACTVARRKHPSDHPAFMLHVEANLVEALSEVESADGRRDVAAQLAITAATLFRGAAASIEPVHCLVLLAEVVEDDLADRIIQAVLLPLQRSGNAHGLAKALIRSATVAQQRGQYVLARHRAQSALKHFGEIKDERRLQVARAILDYHRT